METKPNKKVSTRRACGAPVKINKKAQIEKGLLIGLGMGVGLALTQILLGGVSVLILRLFMG